MDDRALADRVGDSSLAIFPWLLHMCDASTPAPSSSCMNQVGLLDVLQGHLP